MKQPFACEVCFSLERCDCERLNTNQLDFPHALKRGTSFNGFVIGGVIASGGFGITYFGWELSLQRRVAIKECFPSGIAVREKSQQSVRSAGEQAIDVFEKHLEKFFQEGQQIAQLCHRERDGIVTVFNCFRANGTAYLVMEFIEGDTWENWRMSCGGSLLLKDFAPSMQQVLFTLKNIHAHHVIHGDLKPQNILREKNKNKLIDFGAARRLDRNYSGTAWTPGFAGIELYPTNYHTKEEKPQIGPWTDVFGISATLYTMLTGEIPPSIEERIKQPSKLRAPIEILGDSFPHEISAALLKGMAIYPKDRFQDIAELERVLSPHLRSASSASFDASSKQSTSNKSNVEEIRFFLRCVRSSEWLPSQRIPIDKRTGITVGRDASNNQLVLTSDEISRQHAVFKYDEGVSMMCVLDTSTNGTWINDLPISKDHWYHLQHNDKIQFGSPSELFNVEIVKFHTDNHSNHSENFTKNKVIYFSFLMFALLVGILILYALGAS